jgi:hypothetical protein
MARDASCARASKRATRRSSSRCTRAAVAPAALLHAARAYGEAQGAVRLTLSTQVGNVTAQSLYAAAGWQRDSAFFVYDLALA